MPDSPTTNAAGQAPIAQSAAAETPAAPAVEPAIDEDAERGNAIDRLVNAAFARLTQDISPSSVVGAYADWFTHLAAAPGKQRDLLEKAARKWARFALYASAAPWGPHEPAIVPLAQDSRFSASDWRQWPYDLVYQSFLFMQQWWHNATSGVRGVTRHHEQVVTFLTRQFIDVWSPSNFLWTNPQVLQATARESGANLMRGAQYWCDDVLRLWGGRAWHGEDSPRFRPGIEVATTPGKVVFRNHLIELIQYQAATAATRTVPVLLIPSWIMKYYILDLSPENSLVRYLVEHGYTVFAVSWRNPGSGDRELGMDDYLKQGVLAATDAVRRIRPGTRVNACGYCLGGTLLAMAAAYLAREREDRYESITMLATEVDFSEPGELGLFIDESQLAYLEDVMWEQGYLDGKQMAGAFAMLNSRDLVWSRIVHEYLMGERRKPTDLNAWNADATRMPYRQHREYLERLYLRNDLANGSYLVDERPVALTDIRLPFFVVGTERDTVSPWRSVYKIHLLTDTEITFCLTTGGHNVGVVNPPALEVARGFRAATHRAGERYVDPDTWLAATKSTPGSWWPYWESWLRDRSGEMIAAPAPGNVDAGFPPLEDAPGSYVRRK